jgi:hypothetical protein
MGNGRVSTSKFAVTFCPFSSHRHRRSARLRRCQARRTSLPRLKAIEAWTDVEIGGASGRFGEVARASAEERHSDLAVALRLVFSRTVGHSTRGGRNGVGLGDRTRRRSPLGLAGLDHHRQASPKPTHRRSTKCPGARSGNPKLVPAGELGIEAGGGIPSMGAGGGIELPV